MNLNIHFRKNKISSVVFLMLTLQSFAQFQKGQKVFGEYLNDDFGYAVSMPDANTFCVGARFNTPNQSTLYWAGHVRVFNWNNGIWSQKGADIDGEAASDQSGVSVSMPDANTLAVGSIDNTGNGLGQSVGHVRVFSWNGNSWIQKGYDLDGNYAFSFFGRTISMPDSNTIAVGGPGASAGGNQSGITRVFTWNGSAWLQKGSDIIGEDTICKSGYAVSMPDNNTLAISSIQSSVAGYNAGAVRIYSWNGSAWVQKGSGIFGEAPSDFSGKSVCMPDSNTIAVGSTENNNAVGFASGHVRIYYWNGTAWMQKGTDIDGEAQSDNSGISISMPDANNIVIGAPYNDGNGTDAGHARVFRWNGSAWLQRGFDFDGDSTGDVSGFSVSMPDTNTICIGALGANQTTGYAKVFSFTNPVTIVTSALNDSNYCQRAQINVSFTSSQTMNSGNIYTVELSNANGFFTNTTTIGSLSTTASSGTISASLPSFVSPGSQYRVRVISSSPVASSTDNGSNLTIAAPISISFSSGNVNCGQSNGIITSSVSGGFPPYLYYWSNGDRSAIADSLSPGQYKLEILDSKSCQGMGLENIIPLNGPVVSLNQINNVTCNGGSNGSIDVQVSGGLAPLTTLWSTGETSTILTGISAGVYDVSVSDASGCITNASYSVLEPIAISIQDSVVNANCGNADGSIFVTVSGGTSTGYTFSWSPNANSSTNQNVAGVSAGIYTVSVSDANACTTEKIITVGNLNSSVSITLDSLNSSNCNVQPSGAVYVSASGTSSLTYTWNNGSSVQDLIGAIPGNYALLVSDSSLCSSAEQFQIPNKLLGYKPDICLVTVDDSVNRNLVIWEKEFGRGIAAYGIYRQTSSNNVYLRIATWPFDSLSVYKDSIVSAEIHSWRYKITAIDSCGFETEPSDFQKTIHLITKTDSATNTTKLIWDYYDGLPFSKYYISREDISGFTLIDSVNSSVLSYVDVNPPALGLTYRIDAVVAQACNPTLRYTNQLSPVFTAVVKSRSNIKNNRVAGIKEKFSRENFSVFPVPAQEKISVHYDEKVVAIQLSNLMGQCILIRDLTESGENGGQEDFDVSGLNQGLYFVTVKFKNSTHVKRIVIER